MKSALGLGLSAFLVAAAALAAGPFDGTWNGESPGVGRKCPPNTITATVSEGKLSGSYQAGQYKFTVKGNVQPDGTLDQGLMASTLPLTGKFAGNEFNGDYESKECGTPRKVVLHRAG